MKCKCCQNIYNLSNEDDEIVGKWCPKINDSPDIECDRECDHYKPMTNADRIRNMSDEELAYFLVEEVNAVFDCCECDEPESEYGSCISDCKNPMLKWLQAEVKEGETDECS